MDNNLPTDDNQKPVTPVETPPPPTETPTVIPETPEETPTTTPPPVIEETPPVTLPEEPKQETPEPTIEIGSLGQPSLSTLQDVGGKSSSKSKKIKNVVSILSLLLIIAALPLAVVLVKQRQEIRKEAAGVEPSGSANVCGVVLSASHSYSSGRLTTTFTLKNTRTDSASFEFHTYSCVCSGAYQKPCGTGSGSCTSTNDPITLAPGGTTSKTVTAVQSGGDCGSFQNDGFIIAVNGIQNCSNN